MNLPPKGPYKPVETEERILKAWLESGAYKPETAAAHGATETFAITMPPPNANGNLHLGHVSGYAYQDLMGRYQRMQGKKVLLLPGKDHAGIQTEVVFERELDKEGTTKQEIGREEFYKRTYQFCMDSAANARAQEQRIGISADFDRELFTLDPKIVDDVLQTFLMMHDDELIYRGKRLINWCPRCQSALADIDTEYKDSKSWFFYFKYAFTEPEQTALDIKNEYANKTITWEYERSKSSKGEDLPFALGKINNTRVMGIGYDEINPGDELEGKAIGILMRLDKNFALIVANPSWDGDLEKALDQLFLFEIKHAAGAHVIRFDEYPEDKYYTNGFILGTVRPETKFGDTAIAADPKDERYAPFVGKKFEVQTLNGVSTINFIADQAVDAEFGTGIVKVTPAHAPEDWDIASRHPEESFPEKQVIDFHGKLNHLTGKYEGLTVNKARKAMAEDMKEIGMLVYLDTEYENRTQICERCKSRIEPLISHQWFVNTRPLKAKAKQLVEDGVTEIMPEGRQSVYLQWMDSDEDWCITRQLWWGYRIPVWYKGGKSEYVTETGEVKEKIGDTIIENPTDYEGLMHVGTSSPEARIIDAVRHGETDANARGEISGQLDAELTDKGIQQAKEFEPTENYDLIITSPLKRAKRTAEEIAKKLPEAKLIEDELLMERDFGEHQGLTWEEFCDKHPKLAEKNEQLYQPELPQGESISEVEARVDKFIQKLSSEYKGKKILLLTHTGIVRILKRKLGDHSYADSRKDDPDNLKQTRFTIEPKNSEWIQDPDVLDTWFSSGQWPYVTLRATEGDFEEFYPTQVMETGWDILIFWVTRMMMLSTYRAEKDGLTDGKEAPFSHVYLHGLVLDKDGRKMSKSKGNGIDPTDMIEKYGADALRMSFFVGSSAGQNVRLYEDKVSSFGRFMNKIWNATKFVMMNLDGVDPEGLDKLDAGSLEHESNKELLDHINTVKDDVTRLLDTFQFGVAAQILYNEFWHTFADIHIEAAKPHIYTFKNKETGEVESEPEPAEKAETQQVLLYAIQEYLKMLHPFTPFITEELWSYVPKGEAQSETIMYEKW